MTRSGLFAFASLLALASRGECETLAQGDDDGLFSGWFARVSRTQAEQPVWLAPVFTATARLEEMFVYDISQQDTANGDLRTFGGTKGLLLIPAERFNLVITPPSYLVHENPGNQDGFGDMSVLLKYRFAASDQYHANYVLSGFLGATIPTGSHTNGARDAVLTPTIGFGKGWGTFDIQTTLGVSVPVSDAHRLGTPVAYNTAFQYRLVDKLWPELELNATYFPNGPNAGRTQVFLSPGLMVGKFHVWNHLGFAMGVGIQIAVTRFHTVNHNVQVTLRLPF